MSEPVTLTGGVFVALMLGLCLLALVAIGLIATSRAALHRTRKSLQMAGRIGGVGHWRLEPASGAVWWSPEVFRIHARPPEKGQPSLEEAIGYYAEEDRDAVSAAVEKALSSGSSFQFMADLVREDGKRITVVSRGICEASVTGGVGKVFGVFVEQLPVSLDEVQGQTSGPGRWRLGRSIRRADATS